MRTDTPAWGRTPLDAVRQRVASDPTSLAVIDGELSLSIGDVLVACESTAASLSSTGVHVGDCVAIGLLPSFDAITALLACWSLGAVAVPVDIEAQHAHVVAQIRPLRPRALVAATPVAGLDLPTISPARQHHGRAEHTVMSTALDGLAYVMHTSGSTGVPKAIDVTTANLVAQLDGLDAVIEVGDDPRILAATPLTFDPCLVELVWAVSRGVVVVCGSPTLRAEPSRLADTITQHRITHLQLTPSLARLVVDDGAGRRALGQLRQLFVGGESMTPSLASDLLDALTVGSLVNLYGPTETTVWATSSPITDPNHIVLGSPLPGYRIELRDVDTDGVGELWIGGAGVTVGYRHQPDATAAAFHVDADGHRWYATGDLAANTSAGLEYRGRRDHQVKVSGHRIELAALDALCEQVPGVHRAVVVLVGDGADRRLACYVQLEDDATVDLEDIRRAMVPGLPRGFVPRVTPVDELPLTTSGKVDRQLLKSALVQVEQSELTERVRPHRTGVSPVETAVFDAWCDALGTSRIDDTSDFFALGGHSVLAARVIVRMNDHFDLDLGLATFLHAPTFRSFVVAIETAIADGRPATPPGSLVPLTPGRGPVVFVHGRDGNVVDLRSIAVGMTGSTGAVALQARGLDGRAQPHGSIQDMAGDYLTELADAAIEPTVIIGYSGGGLTAREMAYQRALAGLPTRLVVVLDTEAPLVTRPTPLARAWRRLEDGPVSFVRFTTRWLHRHVSGPAETASLSAAVADQVEEVYDAAPSRRIETPMLVVRAWTRTRPWDLGWSAIHDGPLHVVDVGGDHVTMLRAPHAAAVAKAIDSALYLLDSSDTISR
jgi:amino acid adenylation domain-containing protein